MNTALVKNMSARATKVSCGFVVIILASPVGVNVSGNFGHYINMMDRVGAAKRDG